ncbi:MAG: transporter [Naasia sp.]|uniref:MFS transporter n=1 Tax=Naasia sp. TaxID=2546198 RepID=UPI00262089CE|nr:MFS transporter [Naasia sp.]MCU1571090.1 transporter [Naasia sp.]
MHIEGSVVPEREGPRSRPVPRALQPFSSPQYRILVGALTLSLLGSGIWLVALVWQVIDLGGGPAELSGVAAANAVGMLGTVLLGGVLADRVPQKRILLAVEVLKALAIGSAGVLAVTGSLEVWHLAVVSLAYGIAEGCFYPAYSAWLPSLLPAEHLLAANGVEGVLRPAAMQAGGPALGAALIAASSPGTALLVIAAAQTLAAGILAFTRATPVRRDVERGGAVRGALVDIAEGFRYLLRTSWLLGTLLFACLLILVIMGPIEVLLPFAVRDQTGGGAGAFALVLAMFGVGGAIGSIVVASLPLPRRYLTAMNLLWGAGCVPMALIGLTDQLWLMAVVMFAVGFTFQAGGVLWGTLLQRRVPPALLGRVSSLDFFVSLALMPVSMALAGPVGELVGTSVPFLVAGLVPPVLALAALLIFRMGRDELAHPLDGSAPAGASAEPRPVGDAPVPVASPIDAALD